MIEPAGPRPSWPRRPRTNRSLALAALGAGLAALLAGSSPAQPAPTTAAPPPAAAEEASPAPSGRLAGLLENAAIDSDQPTVGRPDSERVRSGRTVTRADDGDDEIRLATFKVIIHSSNPIEGLPADVVSKLFLKRIPSWNDWDGRRVVPVDQREKSEARRDFSRDVHRKRVSAIKSYWQRMIFSGRDVPPTEVSSDLAVVAFVAANSAAIGYVATHTELGDQVKELIIE